MIAAPFAYHAPANIEETHAALARYEGTAKLLAGGQSLLPLLYSRAVRPAVLIDLRQIGGLRTSRLERGDLCLGAMVTHRMLADSAADARTSLPRSMALFLSDVARQIGNLAIRSRGTVCGSLASGDRAAEWRLVMTLLGGDVRRENAAVPARTAWVSFNNGGDPEILHWGDMFTEARLPIYEPDHSFGFAQFAERIGIAAVASAAVMVRMEGTFIRTCRVALSGHTLTPRRLSELENSLQGRDCRDIKDLTIKVSLEPDYGVIDDYVRHVAIAMIARSLRQATRPLQ